MRLLVIYGLLLLGLQPDRMLAQCSATINTFPYNESFEAGTANWTSAGINNDWAWGSPVKPTINSAGAGSKCWIVGGLSASFYNLGERSWVESPCFDFTLLDKPYISFLVFWETERSYDGGNIQYSIDGGSTWKNIGTYNDPALCNTANWYNINNVVNLSFLNNREGWSGTVQSSSSGCSGGNGSGGWKRATHCLGNLSHEPNVKFRFTFGSGTTCNDFDGIAFDDFYVGPSPSVPNDFNFTCVNGNTLRFSDVATTCFDTWSWDFGDPVSPDNTATTNAADHQFSAGGTFSVTLHTSGSCTIDTQIVKQVKILDAEINSTPVSCSGLSDGSASVTINNASPGISFSWIHDATLNSDIATNLSTGDYQVIVSETSVCSVTLQATVDYGPDADPVISLGDDTVICPGSDLVLNPGKFFSYTWQDNSTDSVYIVENEGVYAVRVSNSSGCSATDSIEIKLDCLHDVLMPSAFTPNGDGINELFSVLGSETKQFRLYIFDRWGEIIFNSDDKNTGWDGSFKGNPAQEGFYNYVLNYTIDRDEKIKTGSVYLYR